MATKMTNAKVDYSTMNTSDIVNTVRASVKKGTSVTAINWDERIPECNKTTLSQIGEIFDSNPELANSFLIEIFNRIGLTDMNYRRYYNPLKLFKQGKLEYGESVEEIAFGLIKAKCDYDVQEGVTDVFQITLPEVATAIHKVNYQQKYPQSLTKVELRKAFTSERSLGSFIDGIMTGLYNSYEVDESIAYKNLMVEAIRQGFAKFMEYTPVIDESTGKTFIKAVKSLATKLRFMNTNYSKYGLPQFTPDTDLMVILDADLDAAITVDVWAAAFNMTEVDFIQSGRKVVIDEFPVEGVHAFVCDKRFFQIYDNNFALEWIYNPSNQVYNYFLHVWEIISASPFMQCVAFVEADSGSVTGITVTPGTATIKKGNALKFDAIVEMTGIADPAVAWSIADGTDSTISPVGLVKVGKNETASSLTITATSAVSGGVAGTATITVTA